MRLKPTYRALPWSNIFTGGYNFHSQLECNSLSAIEKTRDTHASVQLFADQAGTEGPNEGTTAVSGVSRELVLELPTHHADGRRPRGVPPLGLLTFAALMPPDWSFELLDLNVDRPSDAALRDRIAGADAVFVGAMSVQKRSLVELLSGPATRGLETPWVLGGPYPSSYRSHMVHPLTASDQILHDGLDLLVWGKGAVDPFYR